MPNASFFKINLFYKVPFLQFLIFVNQKSAIITSRSSSLFFTICSSYVRFSTFFFVFCSQHWAAVLPDGKNKKLQGDQRKSGRLGEKWQHFFFLLLPAYTKRKHACIRHNNNNNNIYYIRHKSQFYTNKNICINNIIIINEKYKYNQTQKLMEVGN